MSSLGADQCLSQYISRFLDGAIRFKSLGDAFVKLDKSGYGAVAWSVLSFGLEVAKNANAAREFIFSSSEMVARLQARYREYESLYRKFQTDTEFENLLVGVYKSLLSYTIALYKYLKQCEKGRFSHALCVSILSFLAHRPDPVRVQAPRQRRCC